MAKLNINIGASANDKSGDTLRVAFGKANSNFAELYTLTGGTSTALTELAQDYAAPLFNHASHVNITAAYDDANNKILLTGTAAQVQSNWTASSGLGVILNKPTLFSGSYTDLTSTPTIPAAAAWPVTNTAGASGPTKVAIGANAGNVTQGYSAVAVGANAGETSQGNSAVAIGEYTGTTNQGDYAVAVGRGAGYTAQGINAVAIGRLAGQTSQAANTIILNATGSAVNGVSAQTNSFYVAPIRTDATPGNVLFYNTTTKEVTYGTAPSTTVSSLVNGAHTVSLGSDGILTLPGILKIDDGVHEKFQTKADATGIVTHDCSLGHIFYHTSPDALFTVNFTNLNLSSGYATALTLIIEQGGTGFIPNSVGIGGVIQTLNWQGNVTPTPSTNRTDVVTFNIINVSGTYIVLGQLTGF